MPTPLDNAFAAAMTDVAEAEAFYNLFLASVLYVPTLDAPAEEGARRAQEGDTFSPAIVVIDGQPTLFIFDTLDRLSDFIQGSNIEGYMGMPGHALLEAMPPGLLWVLNPGLEYTKEFSPAEVAMLKKQVSHDEPLVETVKAGTRVAMGAPAVVPEGLVEALTEALERNNEVQEARLGWVVFEAEGEKPHFALAVTTSGLDDAGRTALTKELTVASRSKLGEGRQMSMFIDTPGAITDGITKAVEPFFSR